MVDARRSLRPALGGVRGTACYRSGSPASPCNSTRERYETETSLLLLQPLEHFLRILPIRRSLEAMQECDQDVPAGALRARTRIDSRFQRVLAQTALDLCEPWRIRRGGDNEDEWRDWEQRRATRAKEVPALLEQYARWADNAGKSARRPGARPKSGQREMWWRQHTRPCRAARNGDRFLRTGTCMVRRDGRFRCAAFKRSAAKFCPEQARHCIGSRPEPLAGSARPLELASPQERIREWTHRIEAEASRRLPDRVELVIPGRLPRWRTMAAREAFLTAFTTYAQAPMSQIVEDYWNGSAKIVREVGRAREIIEYWRDASSPGRQARRSEHTLLGCAAQRRGDVDATASDGGGAG